MDEIYNIKKHIENSNKVKINTFFKMNNFCRVFTEQVSNALRNGNKILICGNGGSAADSQHIAAEFLSILDKKKKSRPALSAISLCSDATFITAHSNDFDFENIFARQISGIGKSGDILIAISTSGSSSNILKAVGIAKNIGLFTISFTGLSGNKLIQQSDLSLIVQSDNTQIIQETYMSLI